MKIDKIVEICLKFEISLNEFFLIYCKLYDKSEVLQKYLLKCNTNINILNLLDKELITLFNNDNILYTESLNYNDIAFVSPLISELILKDEEEASKEIYDAYPDVVNVNGNFYAAKNIPPDDFKKIYYNIYKGDPDEHKRILKATLKFRNSCKNHGTYKIATIGLKKYIDSQFYNIVDATIGGSDTFTHL